MIGDKDSMDCSLEVLIFQEIRKKKQKTSACVLQLWAFHAVKIRKKEELYEKMLDRPGNTRK